MQDTGPPLAVLHRSASFAIATGGVLTLFMAAMQTCTSVSVRVLDEAFDSICEQQITSDLQTATAHVAPPRLSLKADVTAAPVTCDCA